MLTVLLSVIEDDNYRDKFEEIYNTYRKQMFFMAKSILVNDADAEDAVHTVFLKIAQKYISSIVKIENPTDLRNYLLTATKNTALNILKKKNKIIHVSDIVFENEKYVSDDNEFIEYIIAKFEAEQIMTEIKKLNSSYRDVLYLYFVLEMPPKTIAKQLGKKSDTVKKQILRGKSILLNNLQGGITDVWCKIDIQQHITASRKWRI